MNSIPTLLFLTIITASAAPPSGDYAAWLAHHFPAAYPNPALEATVWGDHADPDGDGCPNIIEFMMARDPKTADAHLGMRVRLEDGDLVATYRETTTAAPGVTWLGEWSVDGTFWMRAGVRYETLETHSGHRLVEARVSMNRETMILFRLSATR